MSRINAEDLAWYLKDDYLRADDRERAVADDLAEARALIERMKDQMQVEMWKRGSIVNFPPSYRAAIADAVKFLKDEENK